MNSHPAERIFTRPLINTYIFFNHFFFTWLRQRPETEPRKWKYRLPRETHATACPRAAQTLKIRPLNVTWPGRPTPSQGARGERNVLRISERGMLRNVQYRQHRCPFLAVILALLPGVSLIHRHSRNSCAPTSQMKHSKSLTSSPFSTSCSAIFE